MCGWTRQKRRTLDIEIVGEYNHGVRCRLWVPGGQGDIGRAGGRTTQTILVTRSSTTQVTTADVLPCKGGQRILVVCRLWCKRL